MKTFSITYYNSTGSLSYESIEALTMIQAILKFSRKHLGFRVKGVEELLPEGEFEIVANWN